MGSAVYCLVEGDRFKIGRSISVSNRASIVAPNVNQEKSCAVFFDLDSDAAACERILHKVFRKHRLEKLDREGGTEWFNLACFESVVQFIHNNETHLAFSEIKYGKELFAKQKQRTSSPEKQSDLFVVSNRKSFHPEIHGTRHNKSEDLALQYKAEQKQVTTRILGITKKLIDEGVLYTTDGDQELIMHCKTPDQLDRVHSLICSKLRDIDMRTNLFTSYMGIKISAEESIGIVEIDYHSAVRFPEYTQALSECLKYAPRASQESETSLKKFLKDSWSCLIEPNSP